MSLNFFKRKQTNIKPIDKKKTKEINSQGVILLVYENEDERKEILKILDLKDQNVHKLEDL